MEAELSTYDKSLNEISISGVKKNLYLETSKPGAAAGSRSSCSISAATSCEDRHLAGQSGGCPACRKPLALRFQLRDAALYSFAFRK